MNPISSFIRWIFEANAVPSDPAAEAFLAQSVNLHDLERRMRQLDRQRHIGPFGLNA